MNLQKINSSDLIFKDDSILIINSLYTPSILESELKKLSNPFSKLVLYTINQKELSDKEMEHLIDHCLIKNILIIMVSETATDDAWHYKYISKKSIINSWLFVHPTLWHESTMRTDLVKNIQDGTSNARFLGHQTHITPSGDLDFINEHKIEALRLGQIRQNIDRIEPWCRSVENVIFHTESLRKSDFTVKKSTNMGGLFYEEACKICQFIGASSHLKSIGFYGYNSQADINHSSAAILAQMIWYLIDGHYHFREQKQIDKNKLVQYVVHASHNDIDINFWKSNESGRWWMEVPGHENYWISCTYDDYLEASQGEFSPKLIHALNRI